MLMAFNGNYGELNEWHSVWSWIGNEGGYERRGMGMTCTIDRATRLTIGSSGSKQLEGNWQMML